MSRLTLKLTAVLVIGIAFGSAHVQAGNLPGFTGYSELGIPCDLCDSFVNFTVYERDDANWRDDKYFADAQDAITLDGIVTGRERFVYLYQVTDPVNGLDNALEQFTVQTIPGNVFSGGGYFNGNVFQDAAGVLTGSLAVNYTIANPDPAPGSPDLPGDGVNLRSGGPPSALTPIPSVGMSGGVNPTSLDLTSIWSNLAFDPMGLATGALFQFDPGIPIDTTSSLLFLVSDLAPTYLIGETESVGGSGSLGDIPTPLPEPAGCTLALIVCAAWGMRRRFPLA